MDITDNKYIRYVFNELSKIPGTRYASMIHRKVAQDRTMSPRDKERIETAIALLRNSGYVEERGDGSPMMNSVLATIDKGNKVIDYGMRVEIPVDLLDWLPYEDDRRHFAKLLYDLTGDADSLFPATDQSVLEAVAATGIRLPSSATLRIDMYEYMMQQTTRPVYETFLTTLSQKIENQGTNTAPTLPQPSSSSPSVTNVNITNPVIIGNVSNSTVQSSPHSSATNVSVSGNHNQVGADSNLPDVDNAKDTRSSNHWLELLYWIVGIVVALIAIYRFFIE